AHASKKNSTASPRPAACNSSAGSLPNRLKSARSASPAPSKSSPSAPSSANRNPARNNRPTARTAWVATTAPSLVGLSLSPCLPAFLPLSLIRHHHGSRRHPQHRTDFSPPAPLRRRPGRSRKAFPNALPHHSRNGRPHPQFFPSHTARGAQSRPRLSRHSSPASLLIRLHHVLA